LSSRPCLPCWPKSYEQQGPFAPRELPRLVATTGPSATLSSSADFPVVPVIRPTQLPPFPVGTRRVSPVARCVLVAVPSLRTPPERPAASIGLRRVVLPSPYSCGLGLRDYALTGPPRVHNRYGPTTCAHPPGEVVEGLQYHRFPSGLPSQLRGFRFLPRQVWLLLDTSAFPGRTTVRATFAAYSSSIGQRTFGKHAVPPLALGSAWALLRQCRLPT
jgi:hypothetical protein